MPTSEYKKAKERWLSAKEKFDETMLLFEDVYKMVEYNLDELNTAFSEFSIQQALQVQNLRKNNKVKEVKEE